MDKERKMKEKKWRGNRGTGEHGIAVLRYCGIGVMGEDGWGQSTKFK